MNTAPSNQVDERLERNITKLYLMNFFANAQFHLVVYTLFLLSKGFSTQQFFLIESAYFLIALVMEIPTGVISDRRSRKGNLIAASVIGFPVIPIVVFSNSFIVVLSAMSIGGISAALVSGTDVAILYDTLEALQREDDFQRVLGQTQWFASVSMAVAGIIGGLLAQFDMAYAWWAFFGAGLLALAVQLTLQEPPLYEESEKPASYWQHLGKSLRLALKGDAAYFVYYAAIVWLFFSLGFWLWQPYLKLIAVPVAYFGLIYAGQNLVGGFVAKQAHRVEAQLGMRNALLFIPLLLAVAFFLESQFVIVIGFLFILVHSVSSGLFSPLLADYINKRIPSAQRATVLSVKNMINSLLFITLSPLVGHMVDVYSLTTALFILGVLVTAIGLLFFIGHGLQRVTAPHLTT